MKKINFPFFNPSSYSAFICIEIPPLMHWGSLNCEPACCMALGIGFVGIGSPWIPRENPPDSCSGDADMLYFFFFFNLCRERERTLMALFRGKSLWPSTDPSTINEATRSTMQLTSLDQAVNNLNSVLNCLLVFCCLFVLITTTKNKMERQWSEGVWEQKKKFLFVPFYLNDSLSTEEYGLVFLPG